MRGWMLNVTLGCWLMAVVAPLHAADPPAFEEAAAVAQASVATMRILNPAVETSEATDPAARPRVTVCTGVCVEDGWMVTPAFAGSDAQIRLTLPGGQQSQGKLRVIDEYSGLALIEADTHNLKPIKFATEPPKVGAWVISSAAWGIEQPVISLGILSGQDRTVGGMQYPPLLQADLRTAETSGGAALLNQQGELLGVVVLVDEGKDRRGWTYAVPVSHVQRLLRARVQRRAQDKPMKAASDPAGETHRDRRIAEVEPSVVVLKRRRPVVGMQLDGIGESVVISRLEPGGPAEKAGLKVGDVVQAVDGLKIRSVYQAGRPVLFKQPGDVAVYEVRQGDQIRKVEVTLGGGVEVPNASLEVIGEYISPKVDIEGAGPGRFYAKRGRDQVREVFGPGQEEDTRPAEERASTTAEKIKLLEKAVEGYRSVIVYQQNQLGQRELERRAAEERIQELEKQIESLKASPAR
jgi:S1-C subfamily serine protease